MLNMSNRTLNLQWGEAMQQIKDLVNEEQTFESDSSGEGGAGGRGKKSKKKKKKPPTPEEAFDRLARLYIRYHQVLVKVERCHDGIVQPQKRQDIKVTLELVICRVVALRRSLVELSSSIISAASAEGKLSKKKSTNETTPRPFPECIGISSVLQSMELSPFMEVIVPRYFREESLLLRQQMDLQVHRRSTSSDGNVTSDHDAEESLDRSPGTVLVEAVDGEESKEADKNSADADICTGTCPALSERDAAVKVQSLIRGSISRIHTKKHRRLDAESIGMALSHSSGNDRKALQEACDYAYTRKKQIQLENAESYEVGMGELRDALREEEEYDLRERLYRERMQWIADQIESTQSIPESLEAFYLKDDTNAEGSENVDAANAKSSKGKKDTAPSKDGKGKKSDTEDSSDTANDNVQLLLSSLVEIVNVFESRWKGRVATELADVTQVFDEDLAKDLFIRKEVESAIVQSVDESVLAYLQRVNSSGGARSKQGKTKSGAAKKKGGKSGKKGGKKEKLLPGDKLVGSMSTLDMLGVLASSNMVIDSSIGRVSDLIGSPDAFSPPRLQKEKAAAGSGTSKGGAEGEDGGHWNRSSPSLDQLKSSIIEYCILPNGSSTIKEAIPDQDNVRSIMLYGPAGCGKASMVNAVAHHLGALLIKLSTQLLKDVYLDRNDATRLIHMIFAIARDDRYGPVVIHIEECDQFFSAASGKQVHRSDVVRFQKDLLTYKNRTIKKNDRVIIIGTTMLPEVMDQKITKWKGSSGKPERQGFFEKFLYFPAPGYVDRLMFWKKFVSARVDRMLVDTIREQTTHALHSLDFSLLARSSEGYTAGSIRKTIEHVVTLDRLQCNSSGTRKPLEEELLSHLKNTEHAVNDVDEMRFVGFARAMDEQKITSGDGASDSKGKATKK